MTSRYLSLLCPLIWTYIFIYLKIEMVRRQVCSVGRSSALVVAIVAVIAVAMPVAAANSPQVQGTKCAKAGATRVVKSVSYSCTKIGKTLKWQLVSRGTTSRIASSTTTSSTTVAVSSTLVTTTTVARRTAAQVVADKVNTFVTPMRTRNQAVPTIEYRFAPSVSEADRAMTRQLAESFFKYGSFPQLANYRNAISVSLSNSEAIQTTAPWMNVSGWGNIAGGYIGTGTYALVVQNFTAHRCGTGVTVAACEARGNGGELGRYGLRVNVLHEFSHGGKVALMGFDPTEINRNLERMPMWLASGISNIQGAMLLAVIDGTSYSNPSISVFQAERCRNAPISLASTSDTGGGWGCRGQGTGDFANEILVARFGLDKVLEFVSGSRSHPTKDTWSDWSSAWSGLFQRLFLQSPASFERDVEIYRNAVTNGTDLPADFLEAKLRS